MKNFIGACIVWTFLMFPVALLLNPVLYQISYTLTSKNAEFIGQESAEVGELVRFLAEGEIVRWECLPKTGDCESYGEFNENFVVSFRSPGEYTVIAAIYLDGDLSVKTQTITVAGDLIPHPIEVDAVTPSAIDQSLITKVQGWARKYSIKKKSALVLAVNFETVAAHIRSGVLTTPEQIITKTASINSKSNFDQGLMSEIQAYLISKSDAGMLATMDQHLMVWNSIAQGLRNAAD